MAAKDYRRKQVQWAKRRAAMRKLVDAGQTLAAVGRRYGISKVRVHQIVRRDP